MSCNFEIRITNYFQRLVALRFYLGLVVMCSSLKTYFIAQVYLSWFAHRVGCVEDYYNRRLFIALDLKSSSRVKESSVLPNLFRVSSYLKYVKCDSASAIVRTFIERF